MAPPGLGLPAFCDTSRIQERAHTVYGGHDTHQSVMIDDRQAVNRALHEYTSSVPGVRREGGEDGA